MMETLENKPLSLSQLAAGCSLVALGVIAALTKSQGETDDLRGALYDWIDKMAKDLGQEEFQGQFLHEVRDYLSCWV